MTFYYSIFMTRSDMVLNFAFLSSKPSVFRSRHVSISDNISMFEKCLTPAILIQSLFLTVIF